MIDTYVKKGYWTHDLISDYCDQNALKYPDDEALADSRQRLTWAQVKLQTDRIALGLRDLGFERDDILLEQLYSCVEAFLIRVACEKAGIVLATAAPTFRQAEIEPILQHVRAKGVIIPFFSENDQIVHIKMETISGWKIGEPITAGSASCGNSLVE